MHWWFVWAVALLPLLRSPSALGASNFHLRNHTGALFLYAFDNGQVPTSPPSYVPDRLGLNLMGNLTTSTTGVVSWSADRQGIEISGPSGGPRVVSQRNSSSLLSSLNDEFTVEMFLSINLNPRSEGLLIAGFGSWANGSPLPRCNASMLDSSDGGWRLEQGLVDVIDFFGIFMVGGTPKCSSVSIILPTDTTRHVVVRIRTGTLNVVSHGSFTTGPSTAVLTPSLWMRNPTPLSVAKTNVDAGWTGSIFMITTYNRYLSNDEIASNRAYGPPNSLPTCATTALTALEDGTSTIFP